MDMSINFVYSWFITGITVIFVFQTAIHKERSVVKPMKERENLTFSMV